MHMVMEQKGMNMKQSEKETREEEGASKSNGKADDKVRVK